MKKTWDYIYMDHNHVHYILSVTKSAVISKKKKTMEESRSYRRERKQAKKKKTGRGSGSGFGSIQMEMRRLRVLIPGGRRLNQPDLLLSKTTEYVVHLELRIRFLKTLLSKLIV